VAGQPVQTTPKKGFATNDKILHPDGDFFAISRVAQQLVAGNTTRTHFTQDDGAGSPDNPTLR
jgi:hypothetical protein